MSGFGSSQSLGEVLGGLLGGLDAGNVGSGGVSAITVHDPGFDQTAFLARADRVFSLVQQAWANGTPETCRSVVANDLWLQQKQRIDAKQPSPYAHAGEPHSEITSSHHGEQWDTIVVRFTLGPKWREGWSFQRAATAGSSGGAGSALPEKCPNCGAQLRLDDGGRCAYCKTVVAGRDSAWLLVRTERLAMPADPTLAMASVGRGVGLTVLLAVAVPVIIVLVVVFAVVIPAVTRTTAVARGALASLPGTSAGGFGTGAGTTSHRFVGHLTLSGGIDAAAGAAIDVASDTPDTQPCADRARKLRNATIDVSFDDNSSLSGGVTLPAGKQGPGAYPLGVGEVTFVYYPVNNNVDDQQTWVFGTGSAATLSLDPDGSGSVTFTALPASDPTHNDNQPLSGSLVWTCT